MSSDKLGKVMWFMEEHNQGRDESRKIHLIIISIASVPSVLDLAKLNAQFTRL